MKIYKLVPQRIEHNKTLYYVQLIYVENKNLQYNQSYDICRILKINFIEYMDILKYHGGEFLREYNNIFFHDLKSIQSAIEDISSKSLMYNLIET